jgi:dehydrogenase/reductase SDR family protein 7
MLDYSSHTIATKTVLDKFGTIDTLISNAGRSQRALLEDTELEVTRQMVMKI